MAFLSLRILFEEAEDTEVVGEAGSGSEALAKAAGLKPDVIPFDSQLPDMPGGKVVEKIIRPGFCSRKFRRIVNSLHFLSQGVYNFTMPDGKQTPDLTRSLGGFDPGHLRIVAELWGIEFDPSDPRQAAAELAALLLDPGRVAEVLEDLPEGARRALQDLQGSQGRLPWGLFTRRHGEVREMGPGRRDREQPHRKPASPAEMLWYRSLVGRAFFDTETGPEEFAFIPDDLIPLLPLGQEAGQEPLGRAALPSERAHVYPASDRILDDACTLLAALRLSLPLEEAPLITTPLPTKKPSPADYRAPTADLHPSPSPRSPIPYFLCPTLLKSLLASAGLLDADGFPKPELTRAFLEAKRGEALARLVQAWLESATFNELALIPGLVLEGEWENDPLRARRSILGFLATVPKETWWSLEAFVAAIRQRQPDFQRSAGDYDSWFIRKAGTEAYLRGFEHWEEVDGALVRFTITGPLHWLGVLDLAAPEEGKPVAAFRASRWAEALWKGKAPQGLPEEKEALKVDSRGALRCPARVPRAVRYQVARFCDWEGWDGSAYRYRLTPGSLERARRQGLNAGHLLALLRRHAAAVPPALATALERWEAQGTQARLEQLVVLRVGSPEILHKLRASKATRFLGDPLGPTAVIVRPGAQEKLLAALAELGYLGEIVLQG